LGFAVLKSGVKKDPSLIVGDLVRMVRDQIGGFACFKEAVVVKRLPKTRSGKILRGTMRKMVDGESFRVPPTIDDPAVLKEVEEALKRMKFGD
jgi:propionyl-CoA synthetase